MAQAVLKSILENVMTGFGEALTLITPSDVEYSVKGFSNDIGQTIDPDTGQLVSGRNAQVTLSLESIMALGIGIPEGISSSDSKPWRIRYTDLSGAVVTFAVITSSPDRSLGSLVLYLGRWEES